MSKTFKVCVIFFISTMFLVLARILFGFLNIGENVGDWLFSFVVQCIGMGVIPLIMYKFWVKEDILTGFSIKFKLHPIVYIVSIALGICLHFLIVSTSVLWQNVLILIGFTPANGSSTIYSGPEVLILDIITTACMPAIFEELTYRGLGAQMLEKVKDQRVTLVLMAMLFGLGHQFILQTGYAFVAGLVLAYVMLKTHSVISGMIIHFINNLMSVISSYSSQRNGWYAYVEDIIYDRIFSTLGTVIVATAVFGLVVAGLLKVLSLYVKEEPREYKQEDGVFFYPNSSQYIDEQLFGSSMRTGRPVEVRQGAKWYEYAFLYGAIAIMTLTTLFTYIWGMMR